MPRFESMKSKRKFQERIRWQRKKRRPCVKDLHNTLKTLPEMNFFVYVLETFQKYKVLQKLWSSPVFWAPRPSTSPRWFGEEFSGSFHKAWLLEKNFKCTEIRLGQQTLMDEGAKLVARCKSRAIEKSTRGMNYTKNSVYRVRETFVIGKYLLEKLLLKN